MTGPDLPGSALKFSLAADRTPAHSAAPPPAPTAGAAPPAGQAMDRSWFPGTDFFSI